MKLTKIISSVSIFCLLAVLVLFVEDSPLNAQIGESKRNTQNIQTFVLTSFEDAKNWKAEWSMFATKKFDKAKQRWVIDDSVNGIKGFEGRPWGVRVADEKNVLAVKASFDRKGYNTVEVFPVNPTNGKHQPLYMIGKVQALDLWVWGGNFKYKIEVHLKDYMGYNHVLDGGWLNYIGWRNIRLKVPPTIPQGERYIPRLKTLRFEKFVLISHPAERNDIFYVYFDRMQIQTDIYLQRFDGDEMVQKGTNTGWMPKEKSLRIAAPKARN